MFQDEAGFGRINKPRYCWCEKGIRPAVPCHHIREYRYTYGAVEPKTGESFFLIMPYCNTDCMNVFLKSLSEAYPKDKMSMIFKLCKRRKMSQPLCHYIRNFVAIKAKMNVADSLDSSKISDFLQLSGCSDYICHYMSVCETQKLNHNR